jgi:hypothetical protein
VSFPYSSEGAKTVHGAAAELVPDFGDLHAETSLAGKGLA